MQEVDTGWRHTLAKTTGRLKLQVIFRKKKPLIIGLFMAEKICKDKAFYGSLSLTGDRRFPLKFEFRAHYQGVSS